MWENVGEKTSTEWKTEARLFIEDDKPEIPNTLNIMWNDENTRQMVFAVTRTKQLPVWECEDGGY